MSFCDTQVVWAAHRQLLELLDALAALQMTLQQGPVIAGSFNGNAYMFYLQPLHELWQASLDQAKQLAAATAQHLRQPTSASATAVKQEVSDQPLALVWGGLACAVGRHVWGATNHAQTGSWVLACPLKRVVVVDPLLAAGC
jgi:hypothetical protein